jgi:hypothetical protein
MTPSNKPGAEPVSTFEKILTKSASHDEARRTAYAVIDAKLQYLRELAA